MHEHDLLSQDDKMEFDSLLYQVMRYERLLRIKEKEDVSAKLAETFTPQEILDFKIKHGRDWIAEAGYLKGQQEATDITKEDK